MNLMLGLDERLSLEDPGGFGRGGIGGDLQPLQVRALAAEVLRDPADGIAPEDLGGRT